MRKLSHLSATGEARMVNVARKPEQQRCAIAEGRVLVARETLRLLRDQRIPKGDVFSVARIAGIQAAKRTAELIPLCHPLPIHWVEVEVTLERGSVRIRATVETTGKTGVEMEALTAVSVAALAIYDMCKAVDNGMTISDVRLIEKTKK